MVIAAPKDGMAYAEQRKKVRNAGKLGAGAVRAAWPGCLPPSRHRDECQLPPTQAQLADQTKAAEQAQQWASQNVVELIK
jgi:hypothetical protein